MGWLVPDLQICCSCCGSGLESDPVLGTKALSGDVSRCCLCHLSPASPHRLQPHSRRASSHLPGTPVGHHGLHGQPVCLHGLPALQHAGERSLLGHGGTSHGWAPAHGAILGEVWWRLETVTTALWVLRVPQPL